MLVVRKILPELRSTLATLNGIAADVAPERAAGDDRGGGAESASCWPAIQCGGLGALGTVLTAMQEWLQVPIESIRATPAQVLLKRYVSQA